MPQGESFRHVRRWSAQPVRVFVDDNEVPVDAVEPAQDNAPLLGHRLHFTLPPGTTAIRLASPRRHHEVDTRQLGVAIQHIAIDARLVPLDGPAIRSGFYRLEEGGGVTWRWTNSDAVLVVPELPDAARLTVAVAPWSLPPARTARDRGMRVAVVSWDITHNPVGRAHVLYTLLQRDWTPELIGPAFRRFGTGLWPPLRDEAITLRSFAADTLTDVWTEAAALALAHRYDLVVVSKPRLPGLLTGLLIAEQSRCPLVIDSDESEQAFMVHHGGGTALDPRTLDSEPFGALGTELAGRLLAVADGRTASSPFLQMEHGGHLVRHARDETATVPGREEARRRLGFAPGDFVIAFAGTIRPHKGLATVLAALAAVADPAVRLLLVGPIHDPGLRAQIAALPPGRVVHHEGAPLGGLGAYLAAADLVPLLQDPAARIALSQVPAKLADALQHGVPVVASDVPPLQDLARRGVVDLIQPQDFTGYLKAALSRGPSESRTKAARRVFESEFSQGVNRARLDMAIDEAFRGFNPARRRASEALSTIRRELRQVRRAAPAVSRMAARQDLVFFWKQNDSDLFGRRSDMVAKYLLRSGRFRRVLHFDLPLNMADLRNMARSRDEARGTTGAMQVRTTVARALGLADEADFHRTVMLTHAPANEGVLAGVRTHDPAGFADFVLARMHEHGMDPASTVAWVCPVVWGFSEIARRLGFARVVVDLIDDQRTWKMADDRRTRLEAVYRDTLAAADLVLTNCEGNRQRFLPLRPDIAVVPNGAEFEGPVETGGLPPALAALPRPIIGYVGNMRDRVDWELVAHVAAAHPDWSIAMIGPRDNPEAALAMAKHANVHLLGPVPYETMRACVRHFDVAIVPHRIDAMTGAMNPLKVYNYLAAERPVVATAVANMDDVRDLIAVAPDANGFVAAIARELARTDKVVLPPARRAALSWDGRVAAMLRLLDAPPALAGQEAAGAADGDHGVPSVSAEIGAGK